MHTADGDAIQSDRNLKDNIVDTTPKLADVLKLKVRNFNFKEEYTKTHKRIGFIAQEVEEIFPSLIGETESPINSEAAAGIKENI